MLILPEMEPSNRIGGPTTIAEELWIGFSELLRKARMKHDAGFLQHVAMRLTHKASLLAMLYSTASIIVLGDSSG